MKPHFYQLFVDTGGTFTDCIGIDGQGKVHRRKVLSSSTLRAQVVEQLSENTLKVSTNWELERDILKGFSFRLLGDDYHDCTIESFDVAMNVITLSSPLKRIGNGQNIEISSHEEAPVLGARLLTHTALSENFPDLFLKLGSTKGTNALLERKGAKTLLLITSGFKDLLKIGNQERPDIFALNVKKREQLTTDIIEVDERISANGEVLKSIDLESLKKQLDKLHGSDIQSVAISLINSYVNPIHEQLVRQLVEAYGYSYVSESTNLTPLIKFLPRAETAVVNAYLSPIIHNYVGNIKDRIGRQSFQIMTSAGGLVKADNFQPRDSLLSGPAGGVVGASVIGKQTNNTNLITFDMGGTSTDVSRYSGDFDYRFELNVGDSVINSSAIAIETVAAGGGSICGFDGYKLFVGPVSASAFPGPACYGAGGPLTITDVNLLLGRLDSQRFSIPVFIDDAENRLTEMVRIIEAKKGVKQDRALLLNGFVDIANEIMAGAIRKISISKGYDPKDFAMVAFGGAGGLHACDIADILGVKTILLPQDAGLLSAFGIGHANIERFAERQILKRLSDISNPASLFSEIEKKAIAQLVDEGFAEEDIEIRQRMIFLRFEGQDSNLEIPFSEMADIESQFHQLYEKCYGHLVNNRHIELEAVRVIASVIRHQSVDEVAPLNLYQPLPEPPSITTQRPTFLRDKLTAGAQIIGEALLLDNYSTTYLKPSWQLLLNEYGTAILTKQAEGISTEKRYSEETELELFANRFMAIAENMGAQLQRTALSVNIKERLDFSCALLDADGMLVANAPHIPVHLGGLGVCVQTLLQNFNFEEGDTIVTNHPKFGGSHLPDVTLVTPIFHQGERIAFVVNRAHHSEIGGVSPGSMPPNARNLSEEGVVISPFYLMKNGVVQWDEMQKVLLDAPYPTRAVAVNLADLNAAIAANTNGSEALKRLVKEHSVQTVTRYFGLLKQHAANKMIDTLKGFPNGNYSAEEFLDDGSPLKVSIDLKDGYCTIDFTGSSLVHPGNMNATQAIVHSVTIYVLRLLLKADIPLNEGLLEPVEIIIPEGLLNPKFDVDSSKSPAVVGGNVEISMRLTDTLLKAFGVMAASQGTMNNTLFGNTKFGYYETLCGGCGAGDGFNGASAVHHHMTNTRITDPEIMEYRYPVRLDEFSIRINSGGKGKWHGGDGVNRRLTFLEPVNLSVLSQQRKLGPYGLKGGKSGATGRQYVIRKNGDEILLQATHNIDLQAGDSFIIETPGGGGYGTPES